MMHDMLTLSSNNHCSPYGHYDFLAQTTLLSPETDESFPSMVNDIDVINQGRDLSVFIQPETAITQSLVHDKRKLDHNAKEKERRAKLNDSYSALRSLLPISHRTRKKWSAPSVIARALEYIPELQKEVEKLTKRRDSMLLNVEKKSIASQIPPSDIQALMVSINEVNKGEVITQICLRRDERGDVLSMLLLNIEGEGMWVASASALLVCEDRVCLNLHLHMKRNFHKADYTEVLRDKIISWLCKNNPSSNFSISSDT